MEIAKPSRNKGRSRIVRNLNNGIQDLSSEHNLQFYSIPPVETISLQEFEEYAVERLKVLKVIETAGAKYVKGSEKYNDHVELEIRKTPFKRLLKHSDIVSESDLHKARQLDKISHFILRLAYCRSEELRRWFLQQELDFFRFRFQCETNLSERKKFLEINKLKYEPISDTEKNSVQEQLAQAGKVDAGRVNTLEYFKVPFTEALDLVRARRVYLHQGSAYVPYEEMVSILLSVYRTKLSQALAVTSRALPHLEEDDRLLPMLCGLSKRYLGQDYSNRKINVGQITADMIEMLSKKSFPLCMQHLHQALRQNHHLRHGGRMQYGLFLKGIGLSLDEALKFWRSEFTKIMDGDKFDKQYAYNIRHNYGKEGKRADYTPYSCMKIIMSNVPGTGDYHGCPFRHMDADLLKQKLRAQNIGGEYLDKIMIDLKGNHYQLACTHYFEAVHHLSLDTHNGINHPSQYFDDSQKELNGNKLVSSGGTNRSLRPASQNTPKSKPSQVSQHSDSGEMEDDFDFEAAVHSIPQE
ncbi:hypothetical protein CHS0354_017284 [Potamilus streckersoni]|uniref:DNA primase large subunit n=1 Tax=Potamilus streckersoni TaxID=2493646 RepID=A0AAE0SFY7_9BIVA|nr:hypothetical protein CHS0354_017284 [Potamilus streckersoni]